MARAIRITAGDVSASAELNDSNTASAIWDTLPIEAKAETCGDEIYFAIPVRAEADRAKEVVALGDLGYWPPGHAFCVFFGQMADRRDVDIRPASPVNGVGRGSGDATAVKNQRAGAR